MHILRWKPWLPSIRYQENLSHCKCHHCYLLLSLVGWVANWKKAHVLRSLLKKRYRWEMRSLWLILKATELGRRGFLPFISRVRVHFGEYILISLNHIQCGVQANYFCSTKIMAPNKILCFQELLQTQFDSILLLMCNHSDLRIRAAQTFRKWIKTRLSSWEFELSRLNSFEEFGGIDSIFENYSQALRKSLLVKKR